MKFRNDFITNSSSSSFIISITDNISIPTELSPYLEEIDNNINVAFDDLIDEYFDLLYSEHELRDYEILYKVGFTKQQIKTIMIMQRGQLDEILLILKVIDEKRNDNQKIYKTDLIDRDSRIFFGMTKFLLNNDVTLINKSNE